MADTGNTVPELRLMATAPLRVGVDRPARATIGTTIGIGCPVWRRRV